MKFNKLILIFLCSLIWYCNDDHGHHSKHEHDSSATESKLDTMILNQGAKWEMDLHTRTMIVSMQKALHANTDDSLSGLKALGATLKDQQKKLIVGCTMKGKAHDQLHLILPDLHASISKLINAKTTPEGNKAVVELQSLFTHYNKYFQ